MKDPTVQTATMEDELAKAFQSIEADFESEKQELKLQIDCRMNDTMAKMKARFRSMMYDIASKVKLSDVSEMDGKLQLVKQEMNTVEVPIIDLSSAVNGFAVNAVNSNGSNSNESNSNGSNSNESNGHLNSQESISQPSTSNGLSNGSSHYITETLSPLDFEDAQDLLNGEDYESDSSSVIFEDEIPIDRNASMMASIFKTSDQLVAEELLRQSSSNSNRVEELRKLDLVIANGPSPNTKQLMLNGTNVRMQVVSSVEVVSPPASSTSSSSKSSKQEQQASRSSAKPSKSFDASPIRRSDRIERKRLIENTFNDDSMDFYGDYVDISNWAIDEDSNISSGFDSMKRMSFGPSTTSSSASGKTTATQFLIELTPQQEVPKTIDLPPDFLRRHNVKGKDPMYPQKNGGSGNSNMPRNGTHQRSLPARWKDISTQCYSRTVYMSCPYPGCIAKLSKRDDYDMHMVRHNVKAYRCTIAGCGESFIKHPELGAHFRAAHGQLAEWPCDLCEKVYKGYPRLITHLRYEHEFGLFQCVSPACEYTAKNRKAICDHYVQLHREVNRQYICDYPNCARQCVSNTQLIYHQYHHLTIKPYKCLWERCDQECTRSDAIYRHLEIQHLKLPHPGTMAERKELDKWIEVRHDQILKEPIRFVEVPGLYGNAL